MKNYDEKFKILLELQNYLCSISGIQLDHNNINGKIQMHHKFQKEHNKKSGYKYNKFIDSIINLELSYEKYHMQEEHHNKIEEYQAYKAERFLEKYPEFCNYVNCEKCNTNKLIKELDSINYEIEIFCEFEIMNKIYNKICMEV